MKKQISRRDVLTQGAYAGAMVWLGPNISAKGYRLNEKLNIACIGVNNRAKDDLNGVAEAGENIVALCDVDERYLAEPVGRFPSAKVFHDFRKAYEMKGIDAVVIGTPDHTHAPAALAALQMNYHVYCEKPLTRTVFEARLVTEAAAHNNRVTQLGTQIHAGGNYRRVVELVKGGHIGQVKEVHVWCDKQYGGVTRPSDTPPVPKELHWDLWLGPVKSRPYHPNYVPFNWRNWWAFGGGTLADMACHHMDLPFWALDLRYPTRVEADGPPLEEESTPKTLRVKYDFPARGGMPPVKLTWYHGGRRPEYFAQGALPAWGDGTLFVGEKGMLLADYGRYKLLPEKDFAGFVAPAKQIPDSIGHHKEWVEACKTGGRTTCTFDYSGPLTEAVLLGNVSYRVGQALEWDAVNLKATNCKDADRYLHPHYENGWKLPKR